MSLVLKRGRRGLGTASLPRLQATDELSCPLEIIPLTSPEVRGAVDLPPKLSPGDKHWFVCAALVVFTRSVIISLIDK